MNKLFKVFIFVLGIGVLLNACKKDDSLTEETIIDPTEQKILDFKTKMLNANKSNEPMSIEDAVWNIEAALNYTYCIVSEDIVGNGLDFNTDNEEVEFEVDVNDGLIDFRNVTDYYEMLESLMNAILESYDNSVAFVHTANIEIEEGILKAIFIVKYKESDKALWNISGDWFWGLDQGECDFSQQPKDLINQIEKWISRNRAVYGNVYYTDLVWEGIFLYIVDDHPNPPNCGWCYNIKDDGAYLYHEEYTSPYYDYYEICVSQYECNIWASYSNQALDIILDEYADPGRHVTDWAFYEHLYSEGEYPYEYWIGHRVYVYTGIPHTIPENQN